MDLRTPKQIADFKVSIVKRCIRESVADPVFKALVRKDFGTVPRQGAVNHLWLYMQRFEFVPEQRGDYCKHAIEFYHDGFGDCEDFVVFEVSVLIILGYKPVIKVYDTEGLGYYKHVVLEVFNPAMGRQVVFDGTYRVQGLGGEPPALSNVVRRYRV